MAPGLLRNLDGKTIDSILGVWFKAPNSFTGEDVVELHCHGSLAVLNAALAALYSGGVRPAEAGEFTKRTFINGKLDLSQAEAVGDLIDSSTEEAAINAVAQLGGALSRELGGIYDELVDLLAHFQAVVDYPDEDIEDFGIEKARLILIDMKDRLDNLTEGYQRGKVLKEGINCAIIGRPNVGKSSLMNVLVGYDRAIVTPVAGTTRDIVEAYAKVGGVMLKLHDTAGIRETDDYVENLGVERAIMAAKSSPLVLAVADGTQPLNEEDRKVFENILEKRAILLINKSDLIETSGDQNAEIEKPHIYSDSSNKPLKESHDIPDAPHYRLLNKIGITTEMAARFNSVIFISAKTGDGLDELSAAVRNMYSSGDLRLDGTLITNARQEGACRSASAMLRSAAASLESGFPPDMVLYDVEQGMERIGEILGKNTPDDVVERIFANFCVGK
jgi:tRNA modification GTPase